MPVTIVRGQAAVTLHQVLRADRPRAARHDDLHAHGDEPDLRRRHLLASRDTAAERSSSSSGQRRRRHSVAAPDTVGASGDHPGLAAADVTVAPGASPAGGYLPLSLFGVTPIAGVGDDTITNFNVPAFTFAGETWTRIGVVSNGYVVVGGGTGADVSIINQNFPDASPAEQRDRAVLDGPQSGRGRGDPGRHPDGRRRHLDRRRLGRRPRVQHRRQPPLVRDLDRRQR